MTNFKRGLLLSTLVLSLPALACTKNAVEGFVPENSLKIMVGDKDAGGITKAQFDAVIDKIEPMYAPIIAAKGGHLTVVRNWDDGTVNAYAEQNGKEWTVQMFGGLARHKTITQDGFHLVLCHELGHHLGGAPKYADEDWASNEGQADYFATMKCLRNVWLKEDNQAIVKKLKAPKGLTDSCEKQWSNMNDRAICIRGGMSGDSVARLFSALSYEPAAKFETPDSNVVSSTNDAHPATQCRLDTYFQGALCEKSYTEEFGKDSEVIGACHASTGQKIGTRPLCWFKPSVQ